MSLICRRYQRIRLLGRGTLGEVWRCHDQVAGIDVALKMVPPHLAFNTSLMEQVRTNFQSIERLHHPNIAAAKTLEQDPETGDYYLVMEYVDGVDLSQFLYKQGGKLGLDRLLPIGRKIASALDYCHHQHIIHRDIKPSNIMMDTNGEAKVLDFGMASDLQTSLKAEGLPKQEAVGTDGTLCFMPPEQLQGKRLDGRSDQYALAATIYKLLSGKAPFQEVPDVKQLMEAVRIKPIHPIDGLDERIWVVLKKALSKDPEKRFSSCMEFVDELERTYRGTRSTRHGKARLIIAAATCVLLAAFGIYISNNISNKEGAIPPNPPLPPSSIQPVGINYHALIIGINGYRNGWSKLKNARNDAEAVAKVLKNRYGFQVVLLLDEMATRERILYELEKMHDLDVNDALLIYFAGHGATSSSSTGEEGFWIPAEATHLSSNPGAKAGWVWISLTSNFLEASDARHVLVVADSCYAGSIFREAQRVTHGKILKYSQLLNRPSRYVITSGEASETVFDEGKGHSPFAQHFLKYLNATTNKLFSASDLAKAIRSPYHKHTGKTLRHGPLLRQTRGQFVFVHHTAPEAQNGFVIDLNPEPIVSEGALEGAVALRSSGFTNQADRLIKKIPSSARTNSLTQAVTAYFDPQQDHANVRRLDELIEYIQSHNTAQVARLQAALHEFAQPRVLVVLGPQDQSTTRRGETAATIWRYGLSSALGNQGGLRVVDRKNLEDILSELKISGTDLSDERTRSLIGKVLPASLLLTGEYLTEDQSERIFLRLLATDTTEVLGAFEVSADHRRDRAEAIERVAGNIHRRALSKRPLMAKVFMEGNHVLKAGAGEFHGVCPKTQFELIHRSRQENMLFEEYRDQRVGTATLAYLGENTIDLEPEWEEEVSIEKYELLWIKELVPPLKTAQVQSSRNHE